MKSPKGFGKQYFSLAAILAFSASMVMASQTQSINDHKNVATHKKIAKNDKSINEDDPLVITKKIEEKEIDAPFASEIYTAKDIKNSHSKNLYDFLSSQTSLTIMPSYGNTFSQFIDLRGYGIGDGYENVVITVDGRRLNNIDMQPQLLSTIPVDNIKRIEILKGTGSVEYGDGANAGAINIITKNFNGVSFKTYVGAYGLWHRGMRVGIKREKFTISGFADRTSNKGDRIIANDGTKDNNWNNNKGIKLTLTPISKIKLHIGKTFSKTSVKYANALTLAQYENDPKAIPNPSYGTLYSEQYYSDNVLSYGLKYNINPKISFNFDASYEDKISNYKTYNTISKYNYNSDNGNINYFGNTIKTVIGIQKFNGKRENNSITKKGNLGYFLKSNIYKGKDTFSFGARREKIKYDYKKEAQHLNRNIYLNAYEAGYNHKLTNCSSLFVNINHSFQTPDIDRFFSYNFVTKKYNFNGFIKPMKVNNFNLGYNYFSYPHRFKATFFYANVKNEIYFNTATYINTNLDKTRKYGFELNEQYNIHYNLFVKVNYTYINTKIKKNNSNPTIVGRKIPGVSKHNLKFSLGYNPNYKIALLLSHTYRSKAYAMSDFNENYGKMQSYNSTDFSINYKYKNFNYFAKINNIFDKKNALFVNSGYSLGVYPINYERTFLFGLSIKF